ncbi:MAG: nuclear transport factor 2 family protein [Lapillicoccus sp.]
MTRDEVMLWVDAYEQGWRAEDRSAMERLFTESAQYLRSPYASPMVGHAAIRDFWVDDDEDGSVFTMSAEPVAVDGSSAAVRVLVRYGEPVTQEYRDLWVLRFAEDGRVDHFEEWAYWPDKPYTV